MGSSILSRIGGWLGLSGGGGSRSLENPRRPLDPWSQALDASLDGSLSASGVRVNRDRALTLGAFWRAVNLISGTVAKLPLGVVRKLSPGVEPDPKHSSHRLLSRRPNEYMTAFVWKQVMQTHAVIHGNGYSYIDRRADGTAAELLPLDPERTYPVREERQLWYVHELKGGEKRKLPARDVLHVMGLSHDGLEGHGLLQKAREAIGGALAMQAFSAVFFRNNARPNVALKHPGRLSAEARRNLRESWERLQSGLDNAHKVAILEEGMELAEMSINAQDAQLIESKQFSLIDLANWTNIPPHKLGANVNVSYASLEQENQSFLDDAIDPWLVRWEEECEAKLLTGPQRDRDTHAVCFDRFPLVRADLQQRGAYYVQAIMNGWMSPDEARAREGLNPIPGGAGRVYFFPQNLTPFGVDPDGPHGPAVAPGSKLLEVPDVRQEGDYDCGPAAVQAVCQFFGVATGDLVELLETSRREGTRPARVAAVLSARGLVVTSAGGFDVSDLAWFFAAGQPVLCPVQWPGEDGEPSVGHWVVVTGTGLGQVFYQDPARGPCMATEEDWLARWRDTDVDGVSYERYGIAVGKDLPTAAPPLAAAPSAPDDGGGGGGDGNNGDDDGLRAALRAILTDAARRMVRRVGHAARRAAEKPERFLAWLDTLESEHGETVREAMRLPLGAWAQGTGRPADVGRAAASLLGELRRGCLELAGEARPAELVRHVSAFFEGLETRPDPLMAKVTGEEGE